MTHGRRMTRTPGRGLACEARVTAIVLVSLMLLLSATAAEAQNADLSVTITDAPDPANVFVTPGITYTVTVTNSGPGAASNVVLLMALTPNNEVGTATPPAGWTCTNLNFPFVLVTTPGFECTIASLPVGSAGFTFTEDINFGVANNAVLTANVIVSSTTVDPNPANNLASTTTTVSNPEGSESTPADVTVTKTKTSPAGSVEPGQNVTYTITFTNNGPFFDSGSDTHLVEFTPPDTTFVSMGPLPTGWTCTTPAVGAVGTINCVNALGVASGGSSVFTLTVQVLPGTPSVITTNLAKTITDASTGFVDPVAGNNQVTLDTPIVVNPPAIAKAFGAATVPLNGTTTLTFTLTNPNVFAPLTGVGFTDTLPAGLSVVNGSSAVCGGTLTTSGGNTIALAGATIAAGANCVFPVTVTGTAAGAKTNTTGNVTSTNGGTGNTATASITVVAPPAISKAFSPTTIPLNGTTTLTFTLTNPNAGTGLTGVGFTDTLPAGLSVANGSSAACAGGTLTTSGGNTITLSGGTIAAGGSCVFPVTVTGTAAGAKTNTTGAVTSANGGTGNTATANVTVAAPPTISKAFGAGTIFVGGTTSLTFTLTNPNAGSPLTGVGFTDTLPAGLVVATPNGLTGSCGGGTITATAGSSNVSLSGGSLAAGGSCTFAVNVTGTSAGTKNNTTSAVTSTESGTGNTASASIVVSAVTAPAISKAFGAATVPLNGATTLTFTLTNPNAGTALTGLAFTDTLPAGLIVATPNGQTGTCAGTITATAGSSSVSLSGGSLAAGGSCTFAVNVTATTVGTKNNTTSAVTSTEGGTGNTASASIVGVAPPTIAMAFGVPSIPLNSTTTLTFTLTNPNVGTALTGVGFNDPLPAGLVVGTPSGLDGARAVAPSATCTGTIVATAGSSSVSLSGGTLAAGASCTIVVNVTGTTAGTKSNVTSQVTSTEGGPGNSTSAILTVVVPATITKAFGAASVEVNGTTTLTFTLVNLNPTTVLTGVGFTDTLPAGLTVANPNGLTGTCSGGTITATPGSTSVSLAGATLAPPGASCSFTVNVTATSPGPKNNTTSAVISNEAGAGNTASASLAVPAPASGIPTLSSWTFALLAILLAIVALGAMRARGLSRSR
ncbi:MAG TPA: hypothetical protein VK548_19495 [Candidatus Acidoferrum sp.]|nr:hypothetical protein [Candidatus Acidoferrum sp.]